MHHDTVTTNWRRLTCTVKSLWAKRLDDAADSSLVHAGTVTGGCRSDRDAESTWQAERLATWEDEGGTISR